MTYIEKLIAERGEANNDMLMEAFEMVLAELRPAPDTRVFPTMEERFFNRYGFKPSLG